MTDTVPTGRIAESDFRVGRVFNRTSAVLSRNFPTFVVVTTVAALPRLLLVNIEAAPGSDQIAAAVEYLVKFAISVFLVTLLGTLSQAVVLYGAFQDMRGTPVNLVESLKVGARRFFPIIGLAVCQGVATSLGVVLLIIPGLVLATIWFVATPACVVEQLGPFQSMGRSRQLTKGSRWKILGLVILLSIISFGVDYVLDVALTAAGGVSLAAIGDVIWAAIWGAFVAIFAVVTYHDLRVAKEGIGTEEIVAVFD